MRCLEPSEIQRYVSGSMDPKLAQEVTSHVAACQRCSRLVTEERERAAFPDPDLAAVTVQCPGCGARYGIPQQRIHGRVLKVRCKACGTVVEVRGPATPAPSVLDRGRKRWFAVIHRERVGPMTPDEIRERFQRGEIRPRTYVWRQGFTRWERLLELREFQDLLDGTGAAGTARSKRATRPLAELAGSVPNVTLSIKAPPPRTEEELEREDRSESLDFDRPASRGHGDDSDMDTVDLKKPGPAPAEISDPVATLDASLPDELTSATPSGPIGGVDRAEVVSGEHEPHLSAQRNEDSVLFTVGHLEQMAARPAVDKPQEPSGSTGLFDVRPVAASPAASLIPEPVEEEERRPSGIRVLVVGLGGIALGAVTLFTVLYFVRPELVRGLLGSEPAATTVRSGPLPAPPLPAGGQAGNGQTSRAPRVSPLPPAPADQSASHPAVASATSASGVPRSMPASPTTRTAKPAPEKSPAVSAEPAPRKKPIKRPTKRKPSQPGGEDLPREMPGDDGSAANADGTSPSKETVDKEATPPKAEPDARKPEPESSKPEPESSKPEPAKVAGLTRDQIAKGMRRALGAVQACNEKFAETGMITVEATIEPSGRISEGRVLGALAESALGSCVLDAVKHSARFPTFAGAATTIQYPFVLRRN